MINIQIVDQYSLVAFWLVFTRWLTIIFQLPLFDNVAIPRLVKVLSAILITYAFFPLVKGEMVKDISFVGQNAFWYLTIFNVLIGLAIGFLVKSIMNIFLGAGSVITQQIGFAMLRYFDPNSASRIGPFEKLIQWTMILIILFSGALYPMFKGANASFFSIHIYDLGKLAGVTIFFTSLFKGIFLTGIMLAFPMIFGNLMIMSVLGIIARMVPQMNVIMVSFVVNIGMGLLIFLSCSSEFFRSAFRLYTERLGDWFQFIV